MTPRGLMLVAAAGSGALLLAALAFQHLGGLAPCAMCVWQRYGHVLALGAGAAALVLPAGTVAAAGALGVASSALVGGYHTGVERGWWDGPATCASGSIEGLSTQELVDQIMQAPLVRCDEVAWSLLGLSMASWNMLASLALLALWLRALRTA